MTAPAGLRPLSDRIQSSDQQSEWRLYVAVNGPVVFVTCCLAAPSRQVVGVGDARHELAVQFGLAEIYL